MQEEENTLSSVKKSPLDELTIYDRLVDSFEETAAVILFFTAVQLVLFVIFIPLWPVVMTSVTFSVTTWFLLFRLFDAIYAVRELEKKASALSAIVQSMSARIYWESETLPYTVSFEHHAVTPRYSLG